MNLLDQVFNRGAMFASGTVQKVPPVDDGMNKENVSSSDSNITTVAEMDTEKNRSVFNVPPPISEVPSPKENVSGVQPDTSHATIFTDFNEAEDSEEENYPTVRKRKRNSVNGDYLTTELANDSEPDAHVNKKPGWVWKAKQGPIWKGHEVKHGVPIGVWKLSDEPIDERKHVIYGFLDPKFALHGRKYPERKDGTKYIGNFPSGTGSWAAKTNTWLLDAHLKGLSRKELTEYVRIRMETWNDDETPQERDSLNKRAVAHAKVAAITAEQAEKGEGKDQSPRKNKNGTKPGKSDEARVDTSTSQKVMGESPQRNPARVNSTVEKPEQTFTPSSTAPIRPLAPRGKESPFHRRDSKEPFPASQVAKATPNSKANNIGTSSQPVTPNGDTSKFVVKGRDVLIGYWKDSCEPNVTNKHAIYGVIQANNVFRVKVVPETRDGRPVKGNYPSLQGGCWVNYDTCVLEVYLKDLMRMEIEEYCRFCVADPEYTDGNQGEVIERGRIAAKKKVAEDAAAMGLNVVDYNRKKCDTRDQGAIAREIERQRKRGEIVDLSLKSKVEAKPTAIRSDKAKSDAISQKLKLERKEAKERATANSRADAELAEAMRLSAKEHEVLDAQKEPSLNIQVSSDTPAANVNDTVLKSSESKPAKESPSACDELRQNSNTPVSDGNNMNGSEPDKPNSQVKFYMLDRDAQRAKMERWCQHKPTSQYHTLDRAGQMRLVEKHIDQLIDRQTGSSGAHKLKKRPRTDGQSSASPAQPGVVSAPSPLADVVESNSTPKTATTSPESAVSMLPTSTVVADALPKHSETPLQTPARPLAPKVEEETVSSHAMNQTAQEMPVLPSALDTEVNPHSRSQLNGSVDHTSPEVPVTQRMPVNDTTDAQHTPSTPGHAPVSASVSELPPAPVPVPAPGFDDVSRISHTQPGEDVLMNDAPDINTLATETPVRPAAPSGTTNSTPPTKFSTRSPAANAGQIPRNEQYGGPQQLPRVSQPPYVSPASFWNSSEESPAAVPAQYNTAAKQYVTPYPTPLPLNASDPSIKSDPHQTPQIQQFTDLNSIPSHATPLRQSSTGRPSPRQPSHTPAPEAKEDDDGIKYRIRQTGKFSGLFVSVKGDIVNVDDADFVKYLVLMPMPNSEPPLQQAPEIKLDEDGVKYKMRMNGMFEGHLVGIKREVITLGWDEEYMKLMVLVPV